MIYILKDIGKGQIGSGQRQITEEDLFLIEEDYGLVRLKGKVLAMSNWTLNSTTGKYEYVFRHSKITLGTEVEFIPYPESTQIIYDANIQFFTPIASGEVMIMAANPPGGDIKVNVLIEKTRDAV